MVADLSIREAGAADAPTVVHLLRRMLDEMASLGGHPVSKNESEWACIEAAIVSEIEREDRLFLMAEQAGPDPIPIGLAEARVATRSPIFEPARVLHVHALYVESAHRRQGIAGALLEAVLDWGRASGCVEADLNVLLANPARALYEGLGFRARQVEMAREL